MNFSRIFSISLLVMVVSCKPQKVSEESVTLEVAPTKSIMPEYKEVWMMQGWVGYMGALIALKDKEFDYWFYSDVGGASIEKPLTGTYRRNDRGITLRFSKDSPDIHIYSADWRFVKEDDEVKLAAIDDLNAGRDSGRWLRKVNLEAFKYLYDPNDIFLLQFNSHIEQDFEDKKKLTEDGDPDS